MHYGFYTPRRPHLGTVVVTVLTGACHGEAHAGRVPGTDTGHLAQTTVGLARQTGHTPTRDNALGTVTLGGTQNVDALVLWIGTGERWSCVQA